MTLRLGFVDRVPRLAPRTALHPFGSGPLTPARSARCSRYVVAVSKCQIRSSKASCRCPNERWPSLQPDMLAGLLSGAFSSKLFK